MLAESHRQEVRRTASESLSHPVIIYPLALFLFVVHTRTFWWVLTVIAQTGLTENPAKGVSIFVIHVSEALPFCALLLVVLWNGSASSHALLQLLFGEPAAPAKILSTRLLTNQSIVRSQANDGFLPKTQQPITPTYWLCPKRNKRIRIT